VIKLSRPSAPACLDAVTVATLTAKFKAEDATVWNIAELKEALLETSHSKCAYCECKLMAESNYMEVEHFKHKDVYRDNVLDWDNLLPSCKRCNVAKLVHDVVKEPIVNPYKDDPRDHFKFESYRFGFKTDVGKMTIPTLHLNDKQKIINLRFALGDRLKEALITLEGRLETFIKNGGASRTRNLLVGGLKGILQECQPQSDYSATASTVVLSDSTYISLKSALKDKKLWDLELETLDAKAQQIKLDI